MAASPFLSFPADTLTLDPSWASANCSGDGYYGQWAFDDPPRVLTPVTAMAPTTIDGNSIYVQFGPVVTGGNTYSKLYVSAMASTGATDNDMSPTFDEKFISLGSGGAVDLEDSTHFQGEHLTVHGNYVWIGSGSMIIGTKTYGIPAAAPTGDQSGLVALAASAGNTPVSIASNGGSMLGSTTLSPEIQTALAGTHVSIGSHEIVFGSVTFVLSEAPLLPSASDWASVPDHETLTDSKISTMSGNIFSVGTDIVAVESTTFPSLQKTDLVHSTATSDEPLGAIIVSMFGYAPSSRPDDLSPSMSGAHGIASSTAVGGPTLSFNSTLVLFTGTQSRNVINKGLLSFTALFCTYVST